MGFVAARLVPGRVGGRPGNLSWNKRGSRTKPCYAAAAPSAPITRGVKHLALASHRTIMPYRLYRGRSGSGKVSDIEHAGFGAAYLHPVRWQPGLNGCPPAAWQYLKALSVTQGQKRPRAVPYPGSEAVG